MAGQSRAYRIGADMTVRGKEERVYKEWSGRKGGEGQRGRRQGGKGRMSAGPDRVAQDRAGNGRAGQNCARLKRG